MHNLQDLNRNWDATIIGAGPAGAYCAANLADRKIQVLLLDKAQFPRNKVCGCCLNQETIAMLQLLDAWSHPLMREAVPLHNIVISHGASRANLDLPEGRVITRQSLDTALAEIAAAKGATFLPKVNAIVENAINNNRTVTLSNGSISLEITSKAVIVADGVAGSALRKLPEFDAVIAPSSRIGIGAHLADSSNQFGPGAINMYCCEDGYVGVVRLPGNALDIAAAVDAKVLAKYEHISDWVAKVFRSCHVKEPELLSTADWKGTTALTRRRRVEAERLFVIGDSAGYTEPFTGQGIAWALQSAQIVSPFVEKASRNWDRKIELDWKKAYQSAIASRQNISSVVAKLVRNDFLFASVLRSLNLFPILGSPVIRQLNRTTSMASL
jgi:flavin-dependent dehydrogenase